MPDYDAFLLVSFGGPEGPDDVLPFLRNVTRGRGVPPERLAAVAEHYHAFGGVSPINRQCRDLVASLPAAFDAAGLDLPVYWGNRNWHPFLADTVAAMTEAGVRRAIAFVTSAYSSASGCRQYLDDIARARAGAGPRAPVIDKIRQYFDHPGFIEPFAARTRQALAGLPPAAARGAHLVFTAHSIPTAVAAASGRQELPAESPGGRYVTELTIASRLIAERVDGGEHPWELVYQSRSGPPSTPWLEPDVRAHLKRLAARGAAAAVLVPVGFVSDHMEVRHDLDIEATEAAAAVGLPVARAATPWYDPAFAAMVADLVAERIAVGPDAAAQVCPAGCCRRFEAQALVGSARG